LGVPSVLRSLLSVLAVLERGENSKTPAGKSKNLNAVAVAIEYDDAPAAIDVLLALVRPRADGLHHDIHGMSNLAFPQADICKSLQWRTPAIH
jgi:hypothetical protein